MTAKADEQERARQRRLAKAWLACVGNPDGLLTEEQRLVWEDIRRQGSLDATIARADPAGRLDVERMLVLEGGRGFALHVQRMVRLSQEPEENTEAPAPKALG